jgi:threonine/homoserine/homoserine lactone efflux protein
VPWAYLSLMFVFTVTPGATTALVVSHTLAGGRRRGLTASLGANLANATQALLAIIGVSALIAQWPQGLSVLKIGGALFLAWVGFKSLRRAVNGRADNENRGRELFQNNSRSLFPEPRPFRDGFMVNMLNVSITSFYVGVVPNFLQPGTVLSGVWGLVLLYAAHIVVAFACHMFWMSLFHQARALFTRDRPRRLLDAAFGVVLIALAIRIAVR